MARNPQRLSLKLDPDTVDRYKRIDCLAYGECLNEIARTNWSQWHCNDCEEYERDLEPLDLSVMAAALIEAAE
jgi:hypothetical protein